MKKTNKAKIIKATFVFTFLFIFMFSGLGLFNYSSILAEEITEIDLYHDNPEWQDFWVELGELSAEEIGIKLNPIYFDETETLETRVRTDLRTADAPELFKWWFGERARPIVESGMVEELSDLWDKTEEFINPGVREALTLDGFAYSMPYDVANWVWFYNKEVFEEHGQTPPETFDEFMNQLDYFRENDIDPIAHSFGESWQATILAAELLIATDIEKYERLNRGEGSWTSDTVVEAFEIWKEMLENDYFVAMDYSYPEYAEIFARGEVAYIPMGSWYNSFFAAIEDFDLENVGVTMMPPITPAGEGTMMIEATNMMVSSNAPEVEKAKEWLEWNASSREASELFVSELGLLPWRTHLTEEEIDEASPVFTEINRLDEENPRKAIRFFEAFPSDFVRYAEDQFMDMMLNPENYMEVLENLDAQVEEIW